MGVYYNSHFGSQDLVSEGNLPQVNIFLLGCISSAFLAKRPFWMNGLRLFGEASFLDIWFIFWRYSYRTMVSLSSLDRRIGV